MMRRALLAILLTVLLGPGAAGTLAAAPRASLPDVERQVFCPVCGVPLNLADSPQAQREKDYIAGLIAQGEDTAQIKRNLVDQYGPSVLALPPSRGFDLTVYLVPVAVLVCLLTVLAVMLPRWRRRSPATAGVPALSSADAARLDEDLARFD